MAASAFTNTEQVLERKVAEGIMTPQEMLAILSVHRALEQHSHDDDLGKTDTYSDLPTIVASIEGTSRALYTEETGESLKDPPKPRAIFALALEITETASPSFAKGVAPQTPRSPKRQLWCRYSDFVRLRKALPRNVAKALPAFPGKLVRHTTPRLKGRQDGLNAWLSGFTSFLASSSPPPPPSVAAAASQSTAEERVGFEEGGGGLPEALFGAWEEWTATVEEQQTSFSNFQDIGLLDSSSNLNSSTGDGSSFAYAAELYNDNDDEGADDDGAHKSRNDNHHHEKNEDSSGCGCGGNVHQKETHVLGKDLPGVVHYLKARKLARHYAGLVRLGVVTVEDLSNPRIVTREDLIHELHMTTQEIETLYGETTTAATTTATTTTKAETVSPNDPSPAHHPSLVSLNAMAAEASEFLRASSSSSSPAPSLTLPNQSSANLTPSLPPSAAAAAAAAEPSQTEVGGIKGNPGGRFHDGKGSMNDASLTGVSQVVQVEDHGAFDTDSDDSDDDDGEIDNGGVGNSSAAVVVENWLADPEVGPEVGSAVVGEGQQQQRADHQSPSSSPLPLPHQHPRVVLRDSEFEFEFDEESGTEPSLPTPSPRSPPVPPKQRQILL